MKKVDCILGYHMNPMTCGIAKFNYMLAQKLGVPFLSVFGHEARGYSSPLLSIKTSEFNASDVARFVAWLENVASNDWLAVFLHAYDDTPIEHELLLKTFHVYCGNRQLAERLSTKHSRITSLWCPGTNMDPRVFEPSEISVLSFGMAHKVKAEKYIRLKELLESTGKTYSIYLSTALHEGTSFDDSFSEAYEELRLIYGDNIYFLGYMTDQAVNHYLCDTTYFAAFFDAGLRENNTSVNAALQAGAVVITNLDEYSPDGLQHFENVIDINQIDVLPTENRQLEAIGAAAKKIGMGALGWDLLIQHFNGSMGMHS